LSALGAIILIREKNKAMFFLFFAMRLSMNLFCRLCSSSARLSTNIKY